MLSRNTALQVWAALTVAAAATMTAHATPAQWTNTLNQSITIPMSITLLDNAEGVTCQWKESTGIHMTAVTGGTKLGEIACLNPGKPVLVTREEIQAEMALENDHNHRIDYTILTTGNTPVETIDRGTTEVDGTGGATTPTIGQGGEITLNVIATSATGLAPGKYTGVAVLNIWTL
ncbi:hypothetical protein ITU92_003064 [Salmonella enterica]|nr:hypothetical protein [Salmonella enterica]